MIVPRLWATARTAARTVPHRDFAPRNRSSIIAITSPPTATPGIPLMPLDWAPFVDLVRRHDRFLLTCHVRPDGDALGSMLGLADALERLGKSGPMPGASLLPPRYDFLYPAGRVKRFAPPGDEYRDAQAVVVLDTGTWNQLGDFGALLRELSCPRVVIDHHVTQDDLGAVRLVDVS